MCAYVVVFNLNCYGVFIAVVLSNILNYLDGLFVSNSVYPQKQSQPYLIGVHFSLVAAAL